MEKMTISFNRGNNYFDTYYIYDEKSRRRGIIEDHCRGVKKQYFIGWKLDGIGSSSGKTEMFDTKEEAMIYSVGEVVPSK